MTEHTETFTAALFDATDGAWVELHGKIFECGTYPDRAFSLDETEADAAIAAFAPVPLELEHFFSRDQRSIFDGKLGQLVALWRDGTTLFGRVRVPAFVAACWRDSGNKISAVWDIATKQLQRAGLVLDPYITDAQLSAQFAAFAAQATPKETQRMSWKDKIMEALRGVPDDFEPSAPVDPPVTPPAPVVPAPVADFSAREADIARRERELATQQATFAKQQYWQQAETAVDRLIAEGRVLPAENQPDAAGQPALVALFAQALADDATSGTALFAQAGGTRYAALTACFGARPAAPPTQERLPVQVLAADAAEKPPVDLEARKRELLALTPLGQTVLKREK